MTELVYHETPIVSIEDESTAAAGVTLSVKREDLNNASVSGNKWWKLKLNLSEAVALGYNTILTFGGAYSNHIYATAAAAAAVGLKSIGVIRGEQTEPLNNTLNFARSNRMELHFVSRSDYRDKDSLHAQLVSRFGRFYTIPEGGSNEHGVVGISLFARTLPPDFDYICCPVGTGATLAGLIRGYNGRGMLIGFPVLKGGDSWRDEVENFQPMYDNWTLATDYHFGGYAKTSPILESFMSHFTESHNIPLEHVYSGKMFYGMMDMISKGFYRKGSKILAIHTGGIR